MKSLMKKHIGMVLITFLPMLLSCATTLPGRQYTQGNIIDVGHFSVIGPPGDGWFVNIQKRQGEVKFEKRNLSQSTGLINASTTMIVSRRRVEDKKLRSLSEEEFADAYREDEWQSLIKVSGKKGMPEYFDVKKGTTAIGDKKIYYMSYRASGWIKAVKHTCEGMLYLFLPADFEERHFFYWFWIEQIIAEDYLGGFDLTPIIPVINSLQLK